MEGLNILEGNPAKKTDLEQAVAGTEAIINVLNVSRKSDFPWAKLRTPETFLSDVMSLLIPLSKQAQVRRLVVCSAWGVLETKADIPGWFRWFMDNSNIGAAYRDHERQEALIDKSKIDWTIVRPVGLTNGKKQKVKVTVENNPRPSLTISRLSVAQYLVDCLNQDELIRKKVVISSA